jgi:thiol-disulfide isomerase/thioredoxin
MDETRGVMTLLRWAGSCLLLLPSALLVLACDGSGESGGTGEGDANAAESEDVELAPDFALKDLAGRTVQLSDFRGKTVVIDFWATWCPPCIFQVPELNAVWKSHEAAGDLAVVGVAVDIEGAEVVGPWVEEQGVAYTILLGDESLAGKFGVLGFPTLVLVRPDGSIESLHVGLIEAAELEKLVGSVSG